MSLYIPIIALGIEELRAQGVPEGDIRYALIRTAQKFTPILQRAAPVDTGRLRGSLRVELLLDDSGVALTSEVFYAGFVEFGTKRMRPRLYAQSLVPEILAYLNTLLADLGQITPRTITRGSSGENNGQVSARVTDGFLSRIQGTGKIRGARVGSITVQPTTVERLGIDPLIIQPEVIQ